MQCNIHSIPPAMADAPQVYIPALHLEGLTAEHLITIVRQLRPVVEKLDEMVDLPPFVRPSIHIAECTELTPGLGTIVENLAAYLGDQLQAAFEQLKRTPDTSRMTVGRRSGELMEFAARSGRWSMHDLADLARWLEAEDDQALASLREGAHHG